MKKNLLLISLLFLGVLSMPVGASAEEVNIETKLPKEYVNTDRTKDVLTDTNKIITDYMKQKLSMYDVFVVDKDIHEIPNYSNMSKRTVGLISYKNNEILIHNNYSNENSKIILLHEIGHSIDAWDTLDGYTYKSIGKYSGTNEFKDIFKEECSSLRKYADEYYFETKIEEFFAESFAIFMTKPDVVKYKAPKLYEYMSKIYDQKPVSGWQKNNYGKWYYIENNHFKTGWFQDKDSKWYYFNLATGEMMTTVVIDGYSIAPNGVMIS